ncbi:uncharacterized protein [Amphiura filiformis]|uniref:uncharacterized protein n=1 Tax=Amphiura filiformis TaxID=82378 RepID=UPI003B215045
MDDVAFLLYSSGTTGLPKGVMLTHRNIVSNTFNTLNTPGAASFTPYVDCGLAVLPFYHVYGCVTISLASLKIGVKLVTLPQFEPEVFLKTIQDHKITIGYLVPPLVVFLTKHPMVDNYDLSSLKDVMCGAAPLGGELAAAFKKRLNLSYVRQGYGLTETSSPLTVGKRGITSPASAGVLLINTEAKIVDPLSGKSLPPGGQGELWARGPQIMKGYLKNPEATANCIDAEGWFHTGDIGYFAEDGQLFVVDRLKELIKYKGSQVAPAELEELLLTNPAVADAAVIGIPDEEAGELPKAFVVLKGTEQVTEEDIAKFVAGKVAPQKKLRGGVEFLETIPKSASGKILRRQLRDQERKKRTKAKNPLSKL